MTSVVNEYADLDINKLYFKEVESYPLLTNEEELVIINNLKEFEDSKLLLFKNDTSVRSVALNIPVLFISLIDNASSSFVIDTLLSYYNNSNNSNTKVIDTLSKYKSLSIKCGRALNKEELKTYFNINANTINDALENEELLLETKKFIGYKSNYDKLFNSNLRLVASIASKYKCNLDTLDLINEGNMGLMRAILNYDSSVGAKFSTYATWWIKNYILRAINEKAAFIRIPNTLNAKLVKFKKSVDALECEKNKKLSKDEIAKELKMKRALVEEYLNSIRTVTSFDKPVSDEDDDLSLGDVIPDDKVLEDEVCSKSLKDDISILLNGLDPDELKLIRMKFGLDGDVMQINNIAKKLAVPLSKAKQIEARAFLKLRRRIVYDEKASSLKDYMK